jgi:sugar O-acyltransferase (sialic acid O-acetyltransferase NeuD family)
MKIINTPKVGTSDIEVTLYSVVESGSLCNEGCVYCELETSKSTVEVELEETGYLYFLHETGAVISVGEPLAILSNELISLDVFNKRKAELLKKKVENQNDAAVVFSAKALALIEEHKLDRSAFSSEFISEKDVIKYIEQQQILSDFSHSMEFTQNDVVLVGIGGHAGMCIDILQQMGQYTVVGFVDDLEKADRRYNLPYLGSLSQLSLLSKSGLKNVILGIGFVGNLKKRASVYESLRSNFYIPTIIHPKAIIEPTAIIEPGCQIMAGAIIGSHVTIHENCIINSGAIVSHDSIIDRDSHITPGAVLAGHVNIGKRVTVGMAATIYIGLTIHDDKIIPNGKAVFENI